MYHRSLELTVGVFVLLGALALGFLALEVSGLAPQQADGSYRVSARFENIAGLTARAKVSAAGVTVGRVVGIRYDSGTAGLSGEKYIGLSTGGDPDPLSDGDVIFDTQSAVVLEELIGKFLLNMSAN